MYDLDSIIRDNNRVAMEYMQQGLKRDETIYARPPGGFTLTMLAEKMKTGPPSLKDLIAYFGHVKGLYKFIRLVRKFLPEYEEEILGAPLVQRVQKFGECFSRKYYPLPLNTQASIDALADGMPVEIFGLSYHQYHELNFRPGYSLLLALVIYSFSGDSRDREDDEVPFDPKTLPEDDYRPTEYHIKWFKDLVEYLSINGEWLAPAGVRMIKRGPKMMELAGSVTTWEAKAIVKRTIQIADILGIKTKYTPGKTADQKGKTLYQIFTGSRMALLDRVQGIVGVEITKKIPVAGYTPEELHKLTDNSRFNGCGDFADWACGKTGTIMLDYNYDHGQYIEGNNEPIYTWTAGNVKKLTDQYPKVREIRRKIDHLVEWLELDPGNNFRNLVYYILDQPQPAKKTRPLQYRDEDVIPLDMADDDEWNEDNEKTAEEDRRGGLIE